MLQEKSYEEATKLSPDTRISNSFNDTDIPEIEEDSLFSEVPIFNSKPSFSVFSSKRQIGSFNSSPRQLSPQRRAVLAPLPVVPRGDDPSMSSLEFSISPEDPIDLEGFFPLQESIFENKHILRTPANRSPAPLGPVRFHPRGILKQKQVYTVPQPSSCILPLKMVADDAEQTNSKVQTRSDNLFSSIRHTAQLNNCAAIIFNEAEPTLSPPKQIPASPSKGRKVTFSPKKKVYLINKDFPQIGLNNEPQEKNWSEIPSKQMNLY